MARGHARQDIIRDEGDRERLLNCLRRTAQRFEWRGFAFVLMSSYLHLVLKTPGPTWGGTCQSPCWLMPTPAPVVLASSPLSSRVGTEPN